MAKEDSSLPQSFEFVIWFCRSRFESVTVHVMMFWVCRSHFEYGTGNWRSIAIESLHVKMKMECVISVHGILFSLTRRRTEGFAGHFGFVSFTVKCPAKIKCFAGYLPDIVSDLLLMAGFTLCGDVVAWWLRRRTSMLEVVGPIPAQLRPYSNTLRQGMNP